MYLIFTNFRLFSNNHTHIFKLKEINKQTLYSNKKGIYHLTKRDSSDDFQSTSMNPRAHGKVYLVTIFDHI